MSSRRRLRRTTVVDVVGIARVPFRRTRRMIKQKSNETCLSRKKIYFKCIEFSVRCCYFFLRQVIQSETSRVRKFAAVSFIDPTWHIVNNHNRLLPDTISRINGNFCSCSHSYSTRGDGRINWRLHTRRLSRSSPMKQREKRPPTVNNRSNHLINPYTID